MHINKNKWDRKKINKLEFELPGYFAKIAGLFGIILTVHEPDFEQFLNTLEKLYTVVGVRHVHLTRAPSQLDTRTVKLSC